MLVAMRMGSARFFKILWGVATHERSIGGIAVTRQVLRGSRATVHLKLTLRDGRTVRDPSLSCGAAAGGFSVNRNGACR